MKTIEDLILGQLGNSVKNTEGKIITKEDGTPLTKEEAIAMAILNNAMKGDLKSAQYINALQAQAAAKDKGKKKS